MTTQYVFSSTVQSVYCTNNMLSAALQTSVQPMPMGENGLPVITGSFFLNGNPLVLNPTTTVYNMVPTFAGPSFMFPLLNDQPVFGGQFSFNSPCDMNNLPPTSAVTLAFGAGPVTVNGNVFTPVVVVGGNAANGMMQNPNQPPMQQVPVPQQPTPQQPAPQQPPVMQNPNQPPMQQVPVPQQPTPQQPAPQQPPVMQNPNQPPMQQVPVPQQPAPGTPAPAGVTYNFNARANNVFCIGAQLAAVVNIQVTPQPMQEIGLPTVTATFMLNGQVINANAQSRPFNMVPVFNGATVDFALINDQPNIGATFVFDAPCAVIPPADAFTFTFVQGAAAAPQPAPQPPAPQPPVPGMPAPAGVTYNFNTIVTTVSCNNNQLAAGINIQITPQPMQENGLPMVKTTFMLNGQVLNANAQSTAFNIDPVFNGATVDFTLKNDQPNIGGTFVFDVPCVNGMLPAANAFTVSLVQGGVPQTPAPVPQAPAPIPGAGGAAAQTFQTETNNIQCGANGVVTLGFNLIISPQPRDETGLFTVVGKVMFNGAPANILTLQMAQVRNSFSGNMFMFTELNDSANLATTLTLDAGCTTPGQLNPNSVNIVYTAM